MTIPNIIPTIPFSLNLFERANCIFCDLFCGFR